MRKKSKKSCKKNTLEKYLLATAILTLLAQLLDLISKLVDLISKLVS